jgi:4-diphosphocytidyl-2-C-methyl-D-erythritol kinase
LGSDVPFFLSEGTAYCTGRGEEVYSLQNRKRIPISIIKPAYGMPTRAVYQKVSLPLMNHSNCSSNELRLFLQEWIVHKDFSQLKNRLSSPLDYVNDLEVAAFMVQPKLKQLKEQLLEGGFDTVLLAGSGSSFFCLGHGIIPPDPSLTNFSTTFINRTSSHWYSL